VVLQSGCSEEEIPGEADTWKDPGTVPNPEVFSVAAGAGQTGKLFGKSKDLDTSYVEEEFFFTGTSPAHTAANAIFSQAAMAMRTQTELLLGPGMQIRAVLAGGQSQSSGRLAEYIDSVPPAERLYDGYLLHSGGSQWAIPTFQCFWFSR
jgi:hypothetical protein